MKVSNLRTENRTTYLNVELDKSEVEKHLKEAQEGTEPENKFTDFTSESRNEADAGEGENQDGLFEKALKGLIPNICSRVIQEQGIEAMSQPIVRVNENNPFLFEMAVPLWPKIKLGDYKSLRVEAVSTDVTTEDIDSVLAHMQIQKASLESVDRPSRENDIVVLDIEGEISGSPYFNENGVRIRVAPDSTPDLPGFSENIRGLKKGEEKSFKIQMAENFPDSLMAGKEASFRVKAIDVIEERLPDLDDNLANKIDPDVTSLDVLREKISAHIKADKEDKADTVYEEKVFDSLIGKSELEFSPFMVEAETRSLINNHFQQLQMSCNTEEEYEEQASAVPEEALIKKYQPMAYRKITLLLLLGEIVKAENIEVSEADIDEEIEDMLKEAGPLADEQRKYLDNFQSRSGIKEKLFSKKAVQRLIEIAGG